MSRYYTPAMQAWLGGYTPRAAEEVLADKRGAAAKAVGAKATAKRASAGEAYTPGFGSATGTYPASARDPKKGGDIRKAAKL